MLYVRLLPVPRGDTLWAEDVGADGTSDGVGDATSDALLVLLDTRLVRGIVLGNS